MVNNAGIGSFGALESTPNENIREIFETNTFAAMAMIQAILPQMRERKKGVIVNISSSVTLKSLPLLSVYTASKAAVNAFTESLALELQPFNVRMHLVLPGRAPETSFSATARQRMLAIPDAYSEFAKEVMGKMTQSSGPVTNAADVAEAVWHAINEPSSPMYLPAGADAVEWFESAKN